MSDERIPAWKRAGLAQKAKVKPDTAQEVYNPIESNNKRPLGEDNNKKTPKRPKLPKSERGPPPEPDQLAYLRCYHEDRANWKFSKQKQNWIIRQVWEIPQEYSDALLAYLEGLQGASRPRLIETSSDIVKRWNDFMTIEPETETENVDNEPVASEGDQEPSNEDTKKAVSSEQDGTTTNETTNNSRPPTQRVAERAQSILERLTGSRPELATAE